MKSLLTAKNAFLDLQVESSSLCWLTKSKQLCKIIPSRTLLYCQIYKYINYMFRPLWPSAGWIRNQMKTIYNMVHYIHECAVLFWNIYRYASLKDGGYVVRKAISLFSLLCEHVLTQT